MSAFRAKLFVQFLSDRENDDEKFIYLINKTWNLCMPDGF